MRDETEMICDVKGSVYMCKDIVSYRLNLIGDREGSQDNIGN
jgi:hypothetical protein